MEKNLLQSANEFAAERHAGQPRKGSDIPYIVHPVEVMKIVAGLTHDDEVRAAAVLHDTKEDARVTPEELTERFGERISALVCAESENKRENEPEKNTWKTRKQETIDRIAAADRDVRMICLGDKLANMRDIARDYDKDEEELWKRFNAPEDGNGISGKKANIGWYYRSVADNLKNEFGVTPEWKELDRLIREVFNR